MFQFSDEYIAELLRQIYAGEITAYDLPESLYHGIADNLKTALYEGFGGNLSKFADTPDFELLTELRENIYMFSAAKTFQEVREISSLLTDGDRVRTRSEFNKIGAETFDKWNNDWGKSEYNTAIAQGSMANKWADIQRNKDVLPNLSYSTSGGDVCDICAPLDGLTLPVDAPEWDTIYPPNHFNCACLVTQEDEDAKITPDDDKDETMEKVTEEMSPVFMMNSGKDRVIFNDDHPYFDVARKDVPYAERNFDLPIPPVKEEMNEIIEFHEAKTIKEAEQYAKDFLGCQYANFKGIDIGIANDMNRGLYNTQTLIPELKINGIGVAQEVNKQIKIEIEKGYKESSHYEMVKSNFGKEQADKAAKRFAGANVEKVESGVLAFSQSRSIVKVAGQNIDVSKYKGIFVNATNAKSKSELDNIVLQNEKSGWFTKGAKDFAYIMEHELGHELDNLLHIRTDEDFIKIFDREHKAGLNSVSERLSKYGATAGKLIKHRPQEMIAEAWAEFTTSAHPRELASEIGELILKKYYTDFRQEKGTTYKAWIEKTLKTLKAIKHDL